MASGMPLGADEVTSIILDIGTHTVRAGYGGEEAPKAIFPSLVGKILQQQAPASTEDKMDVETSDAQTTTSSANNSKYFVGAKSIAFRRDFMELESPFNKENLVENWDHWERLVEHAFQGRLHVTSTEHPVLLSEAAYNTASQREKMTQIMFEKFKVPALFIAKSPVLSCFANGKSTALVVDIGASGTVVTPVYDGYALTKSMLRNNFGGDALADLIIRLVETEKKQTIRPLYSFEKKRVAEKVQVKDLSFPNTTQSYISYSKRQIAHDIKETVLQVSETPMDEKFAQTNTQQKAFEMADGSIVEFGMERHWIAEQFFQPSAIKERESTIVNQVVLNPLSKSDPSFVDLKALHLLAHEAIMRCETDIRKDLYTNTILTGGTTLMQGISKRFEVELQAKAPSNIRVKAPLTAQQLPVEKKCSAWIGGSILASTGSFQQLYISKADYEEHGVAIVHKKCP